MLLVAGNSSHKTNQNSVSGGTVSVATQLNLGPTAPTVELTSNIVSSTGTYTVFQTGTGVYWNGTQLNSMASLIGKIAFSLPTGYAVQDAYVDSTGLNVKLVVRRAVTV